MAQLPCWTIQDGFLSLAPGTANHAETVQGVHPEAAMPVATAGGPIVSLNAARVLVVEDDDDERRLVEDLLISEGFDVITAAIGAEALRMMKRMTPDLMVLDLLLPWVNGVEVLSTMRQNPLLTRVPVLVTTGSSTQEGDIAAFAPLVVLRKPLETESVIKTIHALLENNAQSHPA
jgi:DNA-binding response OmpR family regulator